MFIAFTVGDREKHSVAYHWDQLWGGLSVMVDGEITSTTGRIAKPRFRTTDAPITFEVGEEEKHTVTIQRRMLPVLAGFFPMKHMVFVDGELIESHFGY